jgi:hypothetical protein
MTSARSRRRARRQELATTRLTELRKLIWQVWDRRPLGAVGIPIVDFVKLTQFVEGGEVAPFEDKK